MGHLSSTIIIFLGLQTLASSSPAEANDLIGPEI
jgi:hypothetical protein